MEIIYSRKLGILFDYCTNSSRYVTVHKELSGKSQADLRLPTNFKKGLDEIVEIVNSNPFITCFTNRIQNTKYGYYPNNIIVPKNMISTKFLYN